MSAITTEVRHKGSRW